MSSTSTIKKVLLISAAFSNTAAISSFYAGKFVIAISASAVAGMLTTFSICAQILLDSEEEQNSKSILEGILDIKNRLDKNKAEENKYNKFAISIDEIEDHINYQSYDTENSDVILDDIGNTNTLSVAILP